MTAVSAAPGRVSLGDLRDCFEGAVPAVIATASATGVPNVTYLSRVRLVDDERVALSNQFFSKTTRNLSENPRASLLVTAPETYDQYRLTLVFERTDRRGSVFERLREDVDVAAALHGMQDVFRLRAADIYRVVEIEHVTAASTRGTEHSATPDPPARSTDPALLMPLAELGARMSRCPDLDTLVDVTLRGLADILDFEHSLLTILDESGDHLYTLGSNGYEEEGVGSEVRVGDGVVGLAAQRCTTIRIGSVRQTDRYSRTVRRSYESAGSLSASREIPVPGLADANSQLAVPALALGDLIGVLMVESRDVVAFDEADEAALTIVAAALASAIEAMRARDRAADPTGDALAPVTRPSRSHPIRVRFFSNDGSTFIDGDYLIRGVAGRILWSLLGEHDRNGRVDFTNREVRLDPSLELPEYRDNFESRLILLKRRLDERAAPIRIEKTGRGRFRLHVHRDLEFEIVEPTSPPEHKP